MFARLKEDIATIRERDPAAHSNLEVALLYNGLKAVRSHRRAAWFYHHGMTFWARAISQRCLRRTGIDIHPGATIGKGLFIDHGVGVVIGETAVVGDNCTIYQGSTLGGTGKEWGKRHPTLGNNVMVGAGARILGPITIGDNVRIAAGAVVLHDIPADSTAVGVPARVVRLGGQRVDSLDQVHVPDPVSQEICRLEQTVEQLQKKVSELQEKGTKDA